MGMIAMNSLLSAPADGYTLLTDTPASAIDPKLHKEQARYNPKNCGARSSDMGLEEFRSFFRAEIDKWTKVVRKVQIKY